ncbi:MAG: hypothetical protein GY839_10955, partial [candidate division Zixibacteria bacterium]|nr:hypothetical protein [candidate division Zixibacteria bacterium]
LDILTALFTQSNISQKMTSNLVIPLLKNFVRFCSDEDTLQHQIKSVLNCGRRALWCAEQYILSDDDRNAALIAVVDGSTRIPNMHHCGTPLDMLSNTNLNYKSVIEKLLRVKKKKETQGFRDDARRIQYCITKIGIRENLLQMDNTRKNTYLNELFNEHAFKEQSWQTTGFGLWLIARIKLIGDMNAILSLKHIWSNESLDSSYRSAAQEVLIFLKAIKPEERTIFFD